jgi:orotate phosphoribosyltransferase
MEESPLHKPNAVIAEAFVEYALRIGAIELIPEGRSLKSGRLSPYFFNSGLFCTGDSIAKLARAYASVIIDEKFHPDVIFGPAYKGIPLAATIAAALGGEVGYAYNRKEAKSHGEGGLTAGASLDGKRVMIVDDVMTTGDSSNEAVEIIRAHGGTPIGCCIAFDRRERAENSTSLAVQEFEKKFNIPVRSVATVADLTSFLKKTTNGSYEDSISRGKMIGKILAYQKLYGAL